MIPFLLPFFKTVPFRNGSITRRILKQVVLDIAIPKVEDGINVNAVLPIKCEKAYIKAKESNKPIFLDFTGYTCTNCRWMEINIFEQKDVVKLFDQFILVKLYNSVTPIER